MNLSETGAWAPYLQEEADKPYFQDLSAAVDRAYSGGPPVYPPRQLLFAAFQATPPARVRAVILGQDPYHEPGQAQGLSFSVPPGTAQPRSLKNIFRELSEDQGVPIPETGCLRPWAEQGVFLLNAVLSVEAGRAGSHRAFGWETFTDAVITATNALPQPVAFVLWGTYAAKKAALIHSTAPRLVLQTAHPSPLSAYRGFFKSRPFRQINAFLAAHGEAEVDWRL